MEPQNTFIVRFRRQWRDETDPATTDWYGHIQHLQSGDGISFLDERQLLAFIRRYVTCFEAQTSEHVLSSEIEPSATSGPVEPL